MFNSLAGILLVISASSAVSGNSVEVKESHPDVGLNTIQMIERRGYPAEEHRNIQTLDGYLLDLHRIPYGKSYTNETDRPVVLLMHGILSSSSDWVNMGPKKSISYQLVDAGYDVWMGNARGNKWSRKHIIYNPNRDSEFWDFSWHEIGKLDLPTMIDYILNVTGQEQIFYIGHSQGTTAFFVMASEKPEYNAKIRLMVALAPIVYMSNMANPFFQVLSIFHHSLAWIARFLGVNEFLPNSNLFKLIGQIACNDESPFKQVCFNIFFLLNGWNSNRLNESMIPVILSNTPAGASTKQFVHYAQEIRSGRFCQYDYGIFRNLVKYGTLRPPNYHIDNIVVPVGLFYSANDWLAAVVDVHRLASELPNLVYDYLVPDPVFNHIDFLFGVNIRKVLNNKVLALMESF